MMMRRAIMALAALGLAAAAPVAPAGLAGPVDHPYDETADAHAQVEAAFAQAKQTGRTVLLDFGGNWCLDCRILSGVFNQPVVHDWMAGHFVMVKIDVGRRTKNMDIAQRWGVTVAGVPTVLMVTPDGKLLNPDDPFGLSDARSMSSQGVVDLLAKMAKS